MSNYTPKSVLVLDPSLISDSGHHLRTARDILVSATDLGALAKAFCFGNALPQVIDLPATPLFRTHGYVLNTIDDFDDEYAAVMRQNNILLGDLSQVTEGSLTPDDLLIFPTLTYSQVIGACQWIASFPSDTSPKFALGFLFPLDWATDGVIGRSKAHYFEVAFSFIRDRQRRNLCCFCETKGLADAYSETIGGEVSVTPLPTNVAAITRSLGSLSRQKRDYEQVTISFIGVAKLEKGLAFIPDVIADLLQTHKDIQIVVHLNPFDHMYVNRMREMAARDPRLSVSESSLDDDAYAAMLQRCDINVLAYHPANYAERGSALFMESRLCGTAVVVPRDTWMGRTVLADNSGTCFDRFDTLGIKTAIDACIADLPAKTEAAKRIAETETKPDLLAAITEAF